ncbi:MAG: GtrA family protein [Bacteroides sp.]
MDSFSRAGAFSLLYLRFKQYKNETFRYAFLASVLLFVVLFSTGSELVCNFFLTSYFTFRSAPSFKKLFGFGSSHLVNYLLHIVLFNLFLFMGLSKEIAPIIVLAVAVPINFLLLRWVFKKER